MFWKLSPYQIYGLQNVWIYGMLFALCPFPLLSPRQSVACGPLGISAVVACAFGIASTGN